MCQANALSAGWRGVLPYNEESDEILDSFEEMGIIPFPEEGFMIVFDEDHVVEQEGKRYVAGPMIVRTEFGSGMRTGFNNR